MSGLLLLSRRFRAACLATLAGGVLFAGFGPAVPSALAASTGVVVLGQASTYAVLSSASVGNTVSAPGAPFTTLRGDLGVLANAQPTRSSSEARPGTYGIVVRAVFADRRLGPVRGHHAHRVTNPRIRRPYRS